VSRSHNQQQPATKLSDLGICSCTKGCDSRRCSCRNPKDGGSKHFCDPSRCGCCTRSAPIVCKNLPKDVDAPPLPSPIREETAKVVSSFGDAYLKWLSSFVLASWNIQFFGGDPTRVDAIAAHIKNFIADFKIDVLFIQETMDEAAITHIAKVLGGSWTACCVEIGQGGWTGGPEYAAVLYNSSKVITEEPCFAHLSQFEGKFKRVPPPVRAIVAPVEWVPPITHRLMSDHRPVLLAFDLARLLRSLYPCHSPASSSSP
jgi:hypothetical protein